MKLNAFENQLVDKSSINIKYKHQTLPLTPLCLTEVSLGALRSRKSWRGSI